jgi:hypothetical protein
VRHEAARLKISNFFIGMWVVSLEFGTARPVACMFSTARLGESFGEDVDGSGTQPFAGAGANDGHKAALPALSLN